MKRTVYALCAASALALTTAVPAFADITFTQSNQGTGQGQEVLLNDTNTRGTTVLGHTNQTQTGITFTSSQIIGDVPNGQSSIGAYTALSGGTQTTLNNLTFYATDPLIGFSRVEFDLTNTANLGDALMVTLLGLDQFGNPFTSTFDTHVSGQGDAVGTNWLIGTASNGETIQSVSFTIPTGGGNGFTDFRQLRVILASGAVPEPATWAMMLLGFSGIGLAMRSKQRKSSVLAQLA